MREDENRCMERRFFPPPTGPGIISPGAVSSAKHVSAHDGRANVVEIFPGDFVVWTGSSTLHAMDRAERPSGECPFMELLASLTERMLDALVRTGYIAV